MDIIDRLNALRGTAHEVGLAAIEEIVRLRSAANRGGHLAVANAEIERLNTQIRELAMMVDGQVRTILRLQKEDSNDRP